MSESNAIEIQKLKSMQWNYLGVCPCSEPADELVKESYTLKLSRRRDRWNLLINKKVVRFGMKESLFNEIKEYETASI